MMKGLILSSLTELGSLRWLNSIDLLEGSRTYGIADRDYWSWKTKDFPNGTWQAGLSGFLDSLPLLDFSEQQIEKLVSAVISGTQKIQRGNGSFEEAYPLESSYAVTGLVLFELIYSYENYPKYFNEDALTELKAIAKRAHNFLLKTPETHGVISNHRASSLLAMDLSEKLLGLAPKHHYRELLSLQSTEGWFPEYGGADPGYQTLLNHYLLRGAQLLELKDCFGAIERSIEFISYFSFPDGSFSGEIGSRGTSICYPSGTLTLSPQPTQTQLSDWFLNCHLSTGYAMNPCTVDSGNFVPVFNSFAFAYKHQRLTFSKHNQSTPNELNVKHFEKAGLLCASSQESRLAINLKNGVTRQANKANGTWRDSSLVNIHTKSSDSQLGRTEVVSLTTEKLLLKIEGSQRTFPPLNSALKSCVVRVASLILYLFPKGHRAFKKFLAWFVMFGASGKYKEIGTLEVNLLDPLFPVTIVSTDPHERSSFGYLKHMASANSFSERSL